MAQEIERRFLVRDTSFLAARHGERIVQGYVAKEAGAMTTRVRIRGNQAMLTLKGPRIGLTRDEFEYPIPLADAREILARHCARRIIEKTRYLVQHCSHVFEVDVFHGRHAGLVIAEIELRYEHEPFLKPAWLGPEVTHERRYGNFSLALFEGTLLPPALPGQTSTEPIINRPLPLQH